MKISEVLRTLIAEKVFRRTPIGRPLTEFAIENIEAALQDKENQNQPAIRCLNCGLIGSSLLVPEGCSCGSKDLTTEITKANIL